MSSPQPARQPQPGAATRAIRKAESAPTMANVVGAIRALHDDNAERWRGQWVKWRSQEETNRYLEDGMNALLDHFQIPRPQRKNTSE